MVVREAGLEPAHPCGRQDLNLVRLPISPLTHVDVRQRRRDAAWALREHAADVGRAAAGKREREILTDLPGLVSSRRTDRAAVLESPRIPRTAPRRRVPDRVPPSYAAADPQVRPPTAHS